MHLPPATNTIVYTLYVLPEFGYFVKRSIFWYVNSDGSFAYTSQIFTIWSLWPFSALISEVLKLGELHWDQQILVL
jgi:hypothetical protein